MAITIANLYISGITAISSTVITAFATYIIFRTRKAAEIDTLTQKIDEVKDQQVLLTEATEKVKEDIKHQIWKKQEFGQLQREKLEEYYLTVDRLHSYIYDHYTHNIIQSKDEIPEDLWSKSRLLVSLYLPQLKGAHNEIVAVLNEYFLLFQEANNMQREILTSAPSGLGKLDSGIVEGHLKRVGIIASKLNKPVEQAQEVVIKEIHKLIDIE